MAVSVQGVSVFDVIEILSHQVLQLSPLPEPEEYLIIVTDWLMERQLPHPGQVVVNVNNDIVVLDTSISPFRSLDLVVQQSNILSLSIDENAIVARRKIITMNQVA